MTGSESQNTVEKVQKLYTTENDHGTQKAYDALRKDYEDYAKAHGGYGSADTKAYWDDVTNKLGKDVLPNLAVVWGQQNRDRLARGGEYEKYDLGMVQDRRSSSDLDVTMAGSLVKQYDDLKKVHSDQEGGFMWMGTHEKDKITKEDLDDKVSQIDKARTDRLTAERETGENKSNVAKLTGTNDGNADHTLFNKLDAMPGGSKDGHINKADFDRYLKDYDYRKQTGQLDSLTPDQRKKTDDEAATVKYLKDNWDKPEVQRLREMREGNNYWHGDITKESLAKAGGFKDLNDATAKNKVVPEAAPEAKVEPKKEGTDNTNNPAAAAGKPEQAKATEIFDGMCMNKDLAGKLVTRENNHSYIQAEQLNKVLDSDKASGGKELTAAQRDGLTYLKDNFQTLAPNGKFDLADIPRAAFGKENDQANGEAMKAHLNELVTNGKALVDGVGKLGGVEKIGKDGVISKTDLDDKLSKATDKNTDEYKTLQNLRNNFDHISHDGKTVSAAELKAYADKLPKAGGGGGDANSPKQEAPNMEEAAKKFKTQVTTEATQVVGEGPYQAAVRMLPNGSGAEIRELTKLLKKSYQDANNDHTDNLAKLPVGYQWLNEKNMAEILQKSPALAKRIQEAGQAAATNNGDADPHAELQRNAQKKYVPKGGKYPINEAQRNRNGVNDTDDDEAQRLRGDQIMI